MIFTWGDWKINEDRSIENTVKIDATPFTVKEREAFLKKVAEDITLKIVEAIEKTRA